MARVVVSASICNLLIFTVLAPLMLIWSCWTKCSQLWTAIVVTLLAERLLICSDIHEMKSTSVEHMSEVLVEPLFVMPLLNMLPRNITFRGTSNGTLTSRGVVLLSKCSIPQMPPAVLEKPDHSSSTSNLYSSSISTGVAHRGSHQP
jgi:hypothetical protein